MKEDYTVAELCKQFGVASSQKQLLEGAGEIFATDDAKLALDEDNCDKLYQRIGRL